MGDVSNLDGQTADEQDVTNAVLLLDDKRLAELAAQAKALLAQQDA